jgi:hypothetical protein
MADGVRLHDEADQRLNDLVSAIESRFGRTANRTTVASALIHGIPLAQAVGMLDVYIAYTKRGPANPPDAYQESPAL